MFKIRTFLLFLTLTLAATAAFATVANAYSVSAWLPSWDRKEAIDSFQGNADVISSISPFWYHVNGDGTLTPVDGAEDAEVIKIAKANGVKIIPTISNSFDGEKVSPLFNDPDEKKKNIAIIIAKVREMNYDGIDIDYEGLKSEDMDAFTAYIKDLREGLNQYNKKLTIAIQPKWYAALASYGNRGQDWAKLGLYVDEFRIMTYDYGWRGSIPRAVAPEYWVEEVVQYAVDNVPREKIRLGIPFYGYSWSEQYFYSYTYDSIQLILEKYGVDFQYDPYQKTNRLFYISENDTRDPHVPHEIWFENHASLGPKLDLVKKYNLGGIAIWRLGNEDEENWRKIRQILKDEPIGDKLYFEDVNQNTEFYAQITRLADLGIVKGQGGTQKFMPFQTVNRAEILKMVLNSFARNTKNYLFAESRGEDFVNPFSDTPLEHWYFPYVLAGRDFGIIEGYPDGSFKPAQAINRVEAIKLALESAGITVEEGRFTKWYQPYKNWAIEHGLYEGDRFVPEEEITRGEAAYIIAKVIEIVEANHELATNIGG